MSLGGTKTKPFICLLKKAPESLLGMGMGVLFLWGTQPEGRVRWTMPLPGALVVQVAPGRGPADRSPLSRAPGELRA